ANGDPNRAVMLLQDGFTAPLVASASAPPRSVSWESEFVMHIRVSSTARPTGVVHMGLLSFLLLGAVLRGPDGAYSATPPHATVLLEIPDGMRASMPILLLLPCETFPGPAEVAASLLRPPGSA